jgi:hypothetical protein
VGEVEEKVVVSWVGGGEEKEAVDLAAEAVEMEQAVVVVVG